MDVVNVVQGSEKWLEWRRNGIGASDVASIMNGQPYRVAYTDMNELSVTQEKHRVVVNGTPFKTYYQLWLEKTGRVNPPDLSNNPNVRRGIELEAEARDEANIIFGGLGVPVCAKHDEYAFIRASFDCVFANGNILEIKAPGDKVYQKALAYGPPAYYVWQVIDQMAVSDAEKGYLYLYRRDEETLLYRFDRADVEHLIEAVIKAQREFWTKVLNELAPDLDPENDTLDVSDNAEWTRFSEEWQTAYSEEKALKKRYDEAKAHRQEIEKNLATEAGEFSSATDGLIRFTRFTRQGTVDYAQLIADKIGELSEAEVAPYRRKSSIQVKVSLV